MSLKKYTIDELKRILYSDAIQFMLSFYRGPLWITKTWTLREVPLIPKDVDDINQFFGFTDEEIAYIENHV